MTPPLRIGVLASHNGTTLQALLDACESGALHASIVVVISNNSDSGALKRAERHGVATSHLSSRTHPEPETLDAAIAELLAQHQVELVMLAGYMKKLGPQTLQSFQRRIVNTHPSLLPKFGGQGMYGKLVHAAVLAEGEPTTGISIHLVDGDYDTGPVIAQRQVAVEEGDSVDTLAARVQSEERPFLVETLDKIAKGELSLNPDDG